MPNIKFVNQNVGLGSMLDMKERPSPCLWCTQHGWVKKEKKITFEGSH